MTGDKFRKLALELPEVVEKSHMKHPDFRVGGKIFATLGPDGERGMVNVSPESQAALIKAEPETYEPASGAWGRRGCTMVRLRKAKVASIRTALTVAWHNTAPKKTAERGPPIP